MAARPVRIPRVRTVRPAVPILPGAHFVENRAGWIRARRLFLLFGVTLAGLYVGLVVDAFVVTPGLGSDAVALGIFTLAALGCAAAGASVTIARAPRGVWWTDAEMVVRERFSRPRRYPRDVASHVARRHPAGLLAPAPTEIVELVPKTGRPMAYLVDEGLLTESAPG
jgi:hypothetical protein